jgi:hypothetical protein
MRRSPEPVARVRYGAGHDHFIKAALYVLTDDRC